MATLEKQEHRVGRSLKVAEVEALLAEVNEKGSGCEWHLDLSQTQHAQPLAASRLAAALRAMATERLIVTLPVERRGERYRVLYRSGLLAAIAAHAEEVRGEPDDLLERVQSDPYAFTDAMNLVVFNRVDDGGLSLDKDHFASRLWSAMSKSLPKVEWRLPQKTRAALVEIGFEGVANVADHAFAAPFGGDWSGRAAFLLLSWQKDLTAAGKDQFGVSDYLKRAVKKFDDDNIRCLILTIVDDGNGIPARHSLDPHIYEEPLALEEKALASALEQGSSVKLNAADAPLRGDPGWGFSLIADALDKASGYGCLRTGRHLVEFDAFSARKEWTIRPDALPVLRGSVLALILPVPDVQERLPV
jgi:hypothetical protein